MTTNSIATGVAFADPGFQSVTTAALTTASLTSTGGNAFGSSSTDTFGVYGVTPVAQRTTTLGGLVATTVTVSTTTGSTTSWGFANSTQPANLISLVNSIYNALTSLGYIST